MASMPVGHELPVNAGNAADQDSRRLFLAFGDTFAEGVEVLILRRRYEPIFGIFSKITLSCLCLK
jgi:hypothetical protein